MKKNKIILILCLIVVSSLQAQQPIYKWAKTFGGTNHEAGESITVDAYGNIYITGMFKGTADFDPGSGTDNHTSVGLSDVFTQKLDSNGNFLWAKTFGGINNDYGRSISVDASGNVYIIGFFKSIVDFDPDSGIDNHTSAGGYDVFIQKLDNNGNLVWVKTFGGTGSDEAWSVVLDASGNVYTAGFFTGIVDFDPDSGVDNHTSRGDCDAFIQKLDSNGNFLWAKTFGGINADGANSISLDSSGNIYTTGTFSAVADFDPDSGTDNHASVGYDDAFIQKLDSNGNFLWAKTFGGIDFDYSWSIDVDAFGNIYTTGLFQSTADFDPGSGTDDHTSVGYSDIFIQKLNTNGNFLWAKTFGSPITDYCYSTALDTLGNVYTTGSFASTVDFDPGSGKDNHTSVGIYDVFIQKLDSNGNFLWAKTFGGPSSDDSFSIDVDDFGNIYTTGYFQGTADFDPGSGKDNHTSVGGYDVFIQKLGQTNSNTGIYELSNNIQLLAYPNPTTGMVDISFNQAVNEVTLSLTDIQGKLVSNKNYKTLTNTTINLSKQASGIYFLSIKTQNGVSTIKLIKE